MLQNSTSTAAEGVIGSETLDKIQLAKDIAEFSGQIVYSKRYNDNKFEYRHVFLPKALVKYVPERLMTETEWRSLGVTQSPGWEHYMIHAPEPHILLFKRDIDYQAKYM